MVSLKSFRYATRGLKEVLNGERNAKIHLAAALVALVASLVLRISLQEWLFVLISIALVFFAEITNTAIEKTLDLISQENNQVVKRVKDMAAAGVLVAALSAILVAIVVFLPKIVELIRGALQ